MDLRKMMVHAYEVATQSHDPSTQNGTLIIWKGEILATGWNHIPDLTGDRLAEVLADRNLKYPRVIHGEVDAIANAAAYGVPTRGLTMIAPWAACFNCAATMMRARIGKLVVHGPRMRKGHPHVSGQIVKGHDAWGSQVAEAIDRLIAYGIEVESFEEDLPEAPKIRIAEELWQP